jgi:arginine/lysine/ornithine decarboxylase
VYLKSYKAILREVFQENKEVQYEYVMLFVKLSYQLNQGQRQAMLEELTKYDRQIEENDRLREVLAKIDL